MPAPREKSNPAPNPEPQPKPEPQVKAKPDNNPEPSAKPDKMAQAKRQIESILSEMEMFLMTRASGSEMQDVLAKVFQGEMGNITTEIAKKAKKHSAKEFKLACHAWIKAAVLKQRELLLKKGQKDLAREGIKLLNELNSAYK